MEYSYFNHRGLSLTPPASTPQSFRFLPATRRFQFSVTLTYWFACWTYRPHFMLLAPTTKKKAKVWFKACRNVNSSSMNDPLATSWARSLVVSRRITMLHNLMMVCNQHLRPMMSTRELSEPLRFQMNSSCYPKFLSYIRVGLIYSLIALLFRFAKKKSLNWQSSLSRYQFQSRKASRNLLRRSVTSSIYLATKIWR